MDIQKALFCALFAAFIYAPTANAQIPLPCADKESIGNRTCCPIIKNSDDTLPCGEDRGRGQCVNITSMCNQFSLTYDEDDVRENWPHYFTHACECNGTFGGYDCGECKFGWKGEDCTEKESERRRPIADLLRNGSDAEWNEYKDTLYEAKNTISTRYVVLKTDASPGDGRAVEHSSENINIYDLFVWYHHYVAKENVHDGGHDYAHEKAGFLTWHRLFLLWFEREIQVELNKPNFKLYYWDWRGGAGVDKLLESDRFGAIDEGGRIRGNFDNWQTTCWEEIPTVSNCDPYAKKNVLTTLLRCTTKKYCCECYSEWPSYEDVNVAVGMDTFDSHPYNVKAASGLRNYLEGFKSVENCLVEKPFCDSDVKRLLHNSVHLLLGHGEPEGVMKNLAASPNDPLFLNHHTMVDCIFEEWLKRHSEATYPNIVGSTYSGHRANDCIVPFFPVYTHADMFQLANNFGYSCDLPNITPKREDSTQKPKTIHSTHSVFESTQKPITGQGSEDDDDDAASRIALYSINVLLVCLAAVLLQ